MSGTGSERMEDTGHNADSGTSAARLVVYGVVQGVGFRAWTTTQARRLKVAGWVRNRDDGAVEIFAEADKATLELFIDAVKKGPQYARVDRVSIEPARPQYLSNFAVVY